MFPLAVCCGIIVCLVICHHRSAKKPNARPAPPARETRARHRTPSKLESVRTARGREHAPKVPSVRVDRNPDEAVDLDVFRFPRSGDELLTLLRMLGRIANNEVRAEALRRMGVSLQPELLNSAVAQCRRNANVWRLVHTVMRRWCEVDGKTAASWITEMHKLQPDNGQLQALLRATGGWWAGSDAGAAIEWGLTLTPKTVRDEVLYTIGTGIPATADNRAYFESLVGLLESGPLAGAMLQKVTAEMARTDPLGTVARVNKIRDALPGDDYLAHMHGLVRSIVSGWAARDPAAARQWLEQVPFGLAGPGAYRVLARAMARDEGVEAAMLWAQTLDRDAARSAAFDVMASTWSGKGTPAVAAKLLSHVCDSPGNGNALTRAVQKWARHDLKAAEWARGLSERGVREQAVGAAVQAWALDDFERAADWVDGIPEGPERCAGVGALVQMLVPLDLETAVDTAMELPEGFGREQALPVVAAGLGRETQ